MLIKERFIKVIEELDDNINLKRNNEAEIWNRTFAKDGFLLNEGVEPSLLKEFERRTPVEIPKLLKKIWLEINGFAGSWVYEYEFRKGDFTSASLKFNLMPMEEAFGGFHEIENMCDRMGNDNLLQWFLLDIDNLEDNAKNVYIDSTGMDFEKFEDIIRNSIFIEYFSSDLYCWTILKLDARHDEPSIYICYKNALLPLKLNLEEYFDAMFETKGIVFPWPILYVDRKNLKPDFIREIKKKEKTASKIKKDLGILNM